MTTNGEQSHFNNGMNIGIGCGAILATILIGVGSVIWIGLTNSQWRSEAIKHGAARYDADSGEFQWNAPHAEVIK